MNNFFSEKVFKVIRKLESEIKIKKNFLSENECKELLEYLRNIKNKSVGKVNLLIEKKALKFFLILINQNF